ncbi:hypothetical protein LTR94_033871, partial [Friedmanniomyces endolithicus]
AEVVGDRDAVDGEAVETRVLAGEADGAAAAGRVVETGERVATHQVADVAVDRGDRADLRRAEHRCRTLADGTRARDRRCRHDDVAAGAFGGQFDRQVERLGDDRVDVGDRGVGV